MSFFQKFAKMSFFWKYFFIISHFFKEMLSFSGKATNEMPLFCDAIVDKNPSNNVNL